MKILQKQFVSVQIMKVQPTETLKSSEKGEMRYLEVSYTQSRKTSYLPDKLLT